MGWGNTITATKVTHQDPYVVLQPAFGEGGSVICFFGDREELAGVKNGGEVTLEGTVYRVRGRGENALVYLNGCSVADSGSADATQ